MLEIVKNMFRRKLRTSLTIFGIVIGVFALTVMGAMAEKMNLMIDGGVKYLTGQVVVGPKGSGAFAASGGLLTKDKVDLLKKIAGVHKVQRSIDMLLEENQSGASFGMPKMIIGSDLSVNFVNRNYKSLNMDNGRLLTADDKGAVMVGRDVATDKKVKAGDTLKVRGKQFKVVGVIEKMLTGPDNIVYMNIADARALLVKETPFLKQLKEEGRLASLGEFATSVNVSWKDGADPEKIAKRINTKYKDDFTATSPKEAARQIKQFTAIFNLIIVGSGLLALIVGGLSVMNTMAMAISERTREIGLKRALGAKARHIVGEYLTEAALIGLFGGLIGLGLGTLLVDAFNNSASNTGNQIFLVTGRLAYGALIFSVALGVVSGIIPAIHAARLNPTVALKED